MLRLSMKLIVSLTHVIVLLFCTHHLLSQSEVVPKGQNGFEMNYGMGFIEGKNLQLAYIGGSVNGKIDLGVGLASINPNPSYIFGGAYHIGGETDQAGLALSGGYVLFPAVDNYFVFSPERSYISLSIGIIARA